MVFQRNCPRREPQKEQQRQQSFQPGNQPRLVPCNVKQKQQGGYGPHLPPRFFLDHPRAMRF